MCLLSLNSSAWFEEFVQSSLMCYSCKNSMIFGPACIHVPKDVFALFNAENADVVFSKAHVLIFRIKESMNVQCVTLCDVKQKRKCLHRMKQARMVFRTSVIRSWVNFKTGHFMLSNRYDLADPGRRICQHISSGSISSNTHKVVEIQTRTLLRVLYGFLYADVDKAVWVWYEDGLMPFYTSN